MQGIYPVCWDWDKINLFRLKKTAKVKKVPNGTEFVYKWESIPGIFSLTDIILS